MNYLTPMEYLTPVILSGITFDLIKAGVTISAESLRDKLKGWLINDSELNSLASNINKIENIEKLSQIELAEKFVGEPDINYILVNVKQDKSVNNVIQNNNGNGDNIGRDKNIFNQFDSNLTTCMNCDNLISKDRAQNSSLCHSCEAGELSYIEAKKSTIRGSYIDQVKLWTFITFLILIGTYLLIFKDLPHFIPLPIYESTLLFGLPSRVLSTGIIFITILVFMKKYFMKKADITIEKNYK